MLKKQTKYSPQDCTEDKIITFIVEMITHCANMHIPVESISNIIPAEFIVCSKTEKLINVNKNEKIAGSKNQIKTLLKLKSSL